MVSYCAKFLRIVLVGFISQWIMLYLVPRAVSLLCTIMKSETLLLPCWIKFDTTFELGQSYNLSVALKLFLYYLLTLRMEPSWTLLWVSSGVAILNAASYVDVKVFNLFSLSNVSSLSAAYKWHENVKHRAYGQRIREIEHASFTPIILAVIGGLAQEVTIFYNRLASLLATKEYCKVMDWLRCCLSFSLFRSAIACVCGAHSSIGHVYRAPPSLDVVCVESHLNINQ